MKKWMHATLRSPVTMVLVGLALRLALIRSWQSYEIPPERDHFAFGWEIGRVARSIASGQGFSSPLHLPTGPTAWVMPVYTYLVAGVFKLWGIYTVASAAVLLILNCVFSALTGLLVYLIGREAFGSTVAVWAGWAWTFFPPQILFNAAIGWVSDSPLSTLLASLAFLAALWVQRQTAFKAWLGLGFLWGLAGMTNVSWITLLPFVGVWFYYRVDARQCNRVRLLSAVALGFLLTVTPWLVRNDLVFGQFVPWRSSFGLELRVGNPEDGSGIWSWWLHPAANPAEMEKYRTMGEIAYMAEKRQEALQLIESHPGLFAQMTARRFLDWWANRWRDAASDWVSGQFVAGRIFLFNVLFSAAAFLGLRLAFRNRNANALAFAILLAVFPLVYYVTHVSHPRYRQPVEPEMVVLAVYATTAVFSRLPGALGRTPAGSG